VLPLLVAAILCSETDDRAVTEAKTELNFVPVAGGDSDVGVGVGAIGDLAHLAPGHDPFQWRLELGVFSTFKPGDGGKAVGFPYQDFYLELAVPHVGPGGRLRMEVRPSYTVDGTQHFYGVGNASVLPPPEIPVGYERRRAAVIASFRVRMAGPLFARARFDYSRTALDVQPGSVLAELRKSGPSEVRALVDGPDRHGLAAAAFGLEYDSRDSEIVTRTGAFHQVRLRVSPSLGPTHPFQFAEANATLRLYRTPVRWLQLAFRLVGDLLIGHPPIYELTRIDDDSVVGGSKGIRGVPGQRYYGKVKTLGTFEARAQLWRFTWFEKPFELGVAAFADGGRVWADLKNDPQLDGRGLGLKYGVGGGLRLQEGQTFVIRADLAWSPDAQPVGAYFAAGETF
jgi:hypothetical protein